MSVQVIRFSGGHCLGNSLLRTLHNSFSLLHMNLLAHARACSPNPENSKLLKKLEYISRFSTIGIQIAVPSSW
jgi:hypothetical protein